MKLKEILIGVAAVVLVALVAVGATLAYLTATDEETNVMTVGDVDLEILEFERVDPKTKNESAFVQKFNDDKLMIPPILAAGFDYTKPDAYVDWGANSVKSGYTSPIWDPNKISKVGDKMVFVKNTGKLANAYVRLYFAFEAGQYASFEQFQNKIHLNINKTDWDWTWDEKLAEIKGMKCFVACATYKYAIAPGELTNISLSQIALDSYANNSDSSSFGEGYDVMVVGQGIQSDGMGTANAALDKGFGTEIPFAGFKYVDFATLETALHYLDANTNGTKLVGTDKEPNYLVNTVTFGLFVDYYEKIIGHKGVATTNAAGDGEFFGYTYYVPNGDKYDVYILTDTGAIYAPKNSTDLFRNMNALTKVDTNNLDVSKTTSMNYMFQNCSQLTEIDVSDWNVSNVSDMKSTFKNCSSLTGLAVENWNVENVVNMEYIFSDCKNLTSDKFDVSEWHVYSLEKFGGLFNKCESLTSLDLSKWEINKNGKHSKISMY
jgi:predicted ribosomally synthesized peptide with SipW-like signal peptide